MPPMGTTLRTTAAALAALVLIAGCGSDDEAATSTASTVTEASESSTASTTSTTETGGVAAAVATTEPPATEPPATEPPATEPPATEPPATEPPATEPPVDDGSCLVGDWIVTEDQMNAYYAAVTSTFDSPVGISVVGSAPLTFGADGTYGWAPEFTLTLDVVGQTGTGVTGGTITGDWSVTDGVVTTASDVNALTVEVTVAGATFDGDDFANGLLNASPVNGVTYDCSGASPVLDFMTADPGVTVPVALTPA